MPINLTKFIVRKPRVPSVNSIQTLPPTTDGTYNLLNAFTIKYDGGGAEALMHVNAKFITTIIDKDRLHPDNLTVNIAQKTLAEVVSELSLNPNYTVTLQGVGSDNALLVGQFNSDILAGAVQVQYGIPAEYLIEAETTDKFGDVKIRWVKNEFEYIDRDSNWFILPSTPYNVSDFTVPITGIVEIENGHELVLTENPDNTEYDIAYLKTVVDQILISAAGTNTEFVIMPVLQYLVPGTMEIKYNDVVKTEDIDYVLSAEDKRLNFLRSITDEDHILTSPGLNFVDANVQGIAGVIVDSIEVLRNNSPLILNEDYIVPSSSVWQTKDVGSGRVFFTKTYTDDPIAEYVLTTEPSLFNQDFSVKKNSVLLDPSEYVIVLEAGFLNTNTPMFPGDVLTCSYRSQKLGTITDEILTGTPASVESLESKFFNIESGVNDTLVVAGNGEAQETIILPIGSSVSLSNIIAAYNQQAVNTFATYNSIFSALVIASKIPGPSSSVEIFPANANDTFDFTVGLVNGTGSVGGEFAFDLANAPVEITSFTAPISGNTFIIKENDVSANYPPGTLIQLNVDLYLVQSVEVVNRANLYNTPSSDVFKISQDVNDVFKVTVDGTEHIILLTPGDRTPADIVSDINLIVDIADVENLNNQELIKLESPTIGIGGNLIIGDGTANLMLGFKNFQKDSGLPDTKITVESYFPTTYTNPLLRTTKKSVVFITETNIPEKSPPGISYISFNGVDVRENYPRRTVVKINDDIYTVIGTNFQNNKTTVQFTTPLKNPVYTTDVIEYTNRPVFLEGTTDLTLTQPAITDLPVIVKNNNVPLPPTGYKVNSNGSITLSDANKLTSSSNITATYTSFTNFDEGDVITLNYRIFSNVNQGTQVKASYQFESADKFFYDVVYENNLTGKIFDRINMQLINIANPSSTGFVSNAGGSTSNSEAGNETPALTEFKYRYEDDVGKSLFDFYDNRITAFTDERKFYNGMVVGGDDGPVTEAQMQACTDIVSRLFTNGYTKTTPIRVPALDALNQKDDGSFTGGTDNTVALLSLLNTELADLNAEIPLLTALLTAPIVGPVSLLGTEVISAPVLFYDGTGPDPANNEFNIIVNGTPATVTFIGSAAGVSTNIGSIITQINSVTPIASNSGNQVLLTVATSILIQAGSANPVLGFTDGQSAAIRSGSPDATAFFNTLNDEIAQNTASLASTTALVPVFEKIMEEYTGDFVIAFDETKIQKDYIENTLVSELTAAQTQNVTDLGINLNNNSEILTRRDVTVPARIAEINAEIIAITDRIPQIESYLVDEKLLDNRYAWVSFRTNRVDGTIQNIKRAIDNQTNNADLVAIDESLLDSLT